MLLPGARVSSGAQVANTGLSMRSATHHHAERTHPERSAPVHAPGVATSASGGLPRTPPRTNATGRVSGAGGSSSSAAHGGTSGSASRASPSSAWGTTTPVGSIHPAPRTPQGNSSPGPLRTPGATTTACMGEAPTTPTYSGTQQSCASRTAVNAAPQRRPARKSLTDRPSQGVRGGVRAGLPGSGTSSSSQDTYGTGRCSSGALLSAPLRGMGRSGASGGTNARTNRSDNASTNLSASLKVGANVSQAAAPSAAVSNAGQRHSAETPSSPRHRSQRSPSPQSAVEPTTSAPSPSSRTIKWISDWQDIGNDPPRDEAIHQEGSPKVLREREDNHDSSQLSSSPLSPLNDRRQMKSGMAKFKALDDDAPKMRPHLYQNYPTIGLYM